MESDDALPGDKGAAAPSGPRNGLAAVLTALLSSRVRYKLLARFLAGQDTPVHARQLAKDTGEHFNSVWQELKHLQSLGILASEKAGNQVHYRTNPAFPLLSELRLLVQKAADQAIPAAPAPAIEAPAATLPASMLAAGTAPPPVLPLRPRTKTRTAASFVIGEVD